MTTATLSLAAFIERERITAEAVRIAARTDRTGDQWDATARHWVVTLRQVGRGNRNVLAVQYSQGSAHTKAPTCADVLDSLRSDAEYAAADFADFCANLGMDADSRKAEASYRECVGLRERLGAFLGSPAVLRELLENVERL